MADNMISEDTHDLLCAISQGGYSWLAGEIEQELLAGREAEGDMGPDDNQTLEDIPSAPEPYSEETQIKIALTMLEHATVVHFMEWKDAERTLRHAMSNDRTHQKEIPENVQVWSPHLERPQQAFTPGAEKQVHRILETISRIQETYRLDPDRTSDQD